MKTKVVGKVWVILWKGHLEAVCFDSSSALRYAQQWIKDRGISSHTAMDSFKFVERDILKLRLK